MTKRHGAKFTVSYLKLSQLAVQKRIAGEKVTSYRDLLSDLPLPRLTKSGLPRIIPLADRRALLSGSHSIMR